MNFTIYMFLFYTADLGTRHFVHVGASYGDLLVLTGYCMQEYSISGVGRRGDWPRTATRSPVQGLKEGNGETEMADNDSTWELFPGDGKKSEACPALLYQEKKNVFPVS